MYAIVNKARKPVDFGFEKLQDAIKACPSDCYIIPAENVMLTDELAQSIYPFQPKISEKDGTKGQYSKRKRSLQSKNAEIRNIISRSNY